MHGFGSRHGCDSQGVVDGGGQGGALAAYGAAKVYSAESAEAAGFTVAPQLTEEITKRNG